MKDRWWRFVGSLTHAGSTRLGALMQRGGRWHARLFAMSGGRLGRRFFGAEVFVLENVGRRSGQVRETPLLFARDGANYLVLAANAGSDVVPVWCLNLRATPEATAVFRGSRRVAVRAREASGAERDRLWPLLAANYPPVDRYTELTTRELPIVVLEPA